MMIDSFDGYVTFESWSFEAFDQVRLRLHRRESQSSDE